MMRRVGNRESEGGGCLVVMGHLWTGRDGETVDHSDLIRKLMITCILKHDQDEKDQTV